LAGPAEAVDLTETNAGPPTREGSVLANVQRRLKRSADDQEAEVERVRAVTLQRLGGGARPEPPQATVVSAPADDPVPIDDTDPTDPPNAAPVAGVPETDEAIDVTESVDQASAAKVRKPLVFRIAGIDEPPAPVPVDPELDATPLVMFLGAPAPGWTADSAPSSVEVPSVAMEAPAQDTLFSGDRTDLEPVMESEAAGSDAGASEAASPVAESATVAPPEAEPPTSIVPAAPAVASVDAHAYCPYCATILKPPPTSDRRCTECKQQIVVRQVDDRTVWLMEAALPVFEAERRRIADEERWTEQRAHWLDLALSAGAPKGRVSKAAEEAPTEAKVSTARALYLSSVDRSFESAVKDDQWAVAARIRFDEALVLFDLAGAPIPETRKGDAS
jgi:hypothetical protein